MPTGYTADLYEGKETTFPEFAMKCARAFGALVTMRDEPQDTPIPDEFMASSYHDERLAEEVKRLAELEAITSEQADAAADAAYLSAWESYKNALHEAVARKRRYEDMLDKVSAWRPPTAEHEGLRKFMYDQLLQSIEFDCSPRSAPVRLNGADWLQAQIASAKESIEYHTKEAKKERERVAGRNAWIKTLRESLQEHKGNRK